MLKVDSRGCFASLMRILTIKFIEGEDMPCMLTTSMFPSFFDTHTGRYCDYAVYLEPDRAHYGHHMCLPNSLSTTLHWSEPQFPELYGLEWDVSVKEQREVVRRLNGRRPIPTTVMGKEEDG